MKQRCDKSESGIFQEGVWWVCVTMYVVTVALHARLLILNENCEFKWCVVWEGSVKVGRVGQMIRTEEY